MEPATPATSRLSLHDALPISPQFKLDEVPPDVFKRVLEVNTFGTFQVSQVFGSEMAKAGRGAIVNVGSMYAEISPDNRDRKSTRLNSSHGYRSYAVFCLKKNT